MLKFRTMYGDEHNDGHWDAEWAAAPFNEVPAAFGTRSADQGGAGAP